MKKGFTLLLFSLCLYGSAEADSTVTSVSKNLSEKPPSPYSLGLGIGTIGVNFYALTQVNSRFSFDFNMSHFTSKQSRTYSEGGSSLPFSATIDLESIGLGLRFQPWGGHFFLEGGTYYSGNQLFGDLINSGDEIDGSRYIYLFGHRYAADELASLHAKLQYNSMAPFLTLGLKSQIFRSKWGYEVSAGAMYQGNPRVTVEAYGPASTIPQFVSDLTHLKSNIEKTASNLTFWPLIHLAITYRFDA